MQPQQMTGVIQSAAFQSVCETKAHWHEITLSLSAPSSHQLQFQPLPLLWALQTAAYTPAIMLQQPLL
jgi:hypothetical protein